MKKRGIICAIALVSICVFCIGIRLHLSRVAAQRRQVELAEEKARLVQHTEDEFAFYLREEVLGESADDLKLMFAEVNVEQKKNESIDLKVYANALFKDGDLIKANEDKIREHIDDEMRKYETEILMKIKNQNFDSIAERNDIDFETLIRIYESHKFWQNIDEEITKRDTYIEELRELQSELDYFFANYKKYYVRNKNYVCTNDEVFKKLGAFSKKYGLNWKVVKQVINPNGVPILCYHGVLDIPWGIQSLFVRVSDFEAQMKYLSESGYTPIFVSEIANAKSYKKPIVITFDDGYKDVYTNAFPILQKYNMKANVYMISGWLGGDVYMTSAMTKEMSDSPLIEIGSHTVSHRPLATLSDEDIEKELSESKTILENITGKSVTVVAYPTGSFDSRVTRIASKYYQYGLSTINGKENPAYLNRYSLRRIYVYRHYDLEQFKNLL